MNTKRIPIGVSDFKKIVTGNYYYVDKTLFIKEILDRGDAIILIPRPRRFGKTLNLSMLGYFYDCCPDPKATLLPSDPAANLENRKLFESLAIGKEDKKYFENQGQHPVIFLTFKDVKETSWEGCLTEIKKMIQLQYERHIYLIQNQEMLPHNKYYFEQILNLSGDKNHYQSSLKSLMIFLTRYYGKRPVVLIDEYDAPIHAGFQYGYYDEVINFMRNFLSGGLKDMDQYLEKAVLTGILRIAKESIFSGLNNLGVFSLTSSVFEDKFGFTEKEMEKLLNDFDLTHLYDDIKKWYNGYFFGDQTIYNPWSILNFIGDPKKEFKPYWVNTANNAIIDGYLSKGGQDLKEELEWLIQGESIVKTIDENIIMKDIEIRDELLWSFLLMSGYLKQSVSGRDSFTQKIYYTLTIPNIEVKTVYIDIISRFFSAKMEDRQVETMLKALISGEIDVFEEKLQLIVAALFSYHDFSGEPEKVYHALVMGLLVWISGTHEIQSNRESGFGRYDIMIIPRDLKGLGFVIEFKAVRKIKKETLKSAVESAFKQIEEKGYDAYLKERGVARFKKLVIAFMGKKVHVKCRD